MKQYLIIKQFTLKDKHFIKDQMLSCENESESNIKRLVAGGYIKTIATIDTDYKEPTYYEGAKGFLIPLEVNKLKLTDLIKYANQIGVNDFDSKIKVSDLRKLVNGFIAENSEDEDDSNVEYFLTPDEVAKLSRQELSDYANEIGVSFAYDITDADLIILVNEFIVKALQKGGENA